VGPGRPEGSHEEYISKRADENCRFRCRGVFIVLTGHITAALRSAVRTTLRLRSQLLIADFAARWIAK
jgi:hypothetical protein